MSDCADSPAFGLPDLLPRLDEAMKHLAPQLNGLPEPSWDCRLHPGLPTVRELVHDAEWQARVHLTALQTGVLLDLMGERVRDEPVRALEERLLATHTALSRFLQREYAGASLIQEVCILRPVPLGYYLVDAIAQLESLADRVCMLRRGIDPTWGRGQAL